ncbi:MAG: glycosyl transferase family 2 [Candidatus Rokuibacteriota bacterium]|nr:MAG: glycosyl transferase family 2 [Candidatus Rokubacteria bacterium]
MKATELAPCIVVIIPCFNEEPHIARVISSVPPSVRTIVVVDDASTDGTRGVLERLRDARLVLVAHDRNQGVGAAVISGYREAMARDADICVKMDADGQMSPEYLPSLLERVVAGRADYAKGNRFWDIAALARMPRARLLGNSLLSFFVKLVSGYWSILDPMNGYTAIRSVVLKQLNFARLARGFFFETSMLIELNILGAVVEDVPMPARYGDEESSLRLSNVLGTFPFLLLKGLARRFIWRYVLQDFNALTACVLCGIPCILFGTIFGAYRWWLSIATGTPATAGTIILAALPIILGVQWLLTALVLDMLYQPKGRA